MRLFGSLRELARIFWREDGQEISLDANSATTYTADRSLELPPGDSNSTLVGETNTQTLTGKTIDADGAGNVISNIDDGNIKALAAIDATKIADGSVSNAEFQSLNGVTGTIVTEAGTQTLTNKTIDGDDNTIQDLALTSLKTVLADADKVIRRDAAGIVISGNAVPNSSALVTTDSTSTLTNKTIDADGTGNSISNIDDGNIKASAGIDATKIADASVDNTEFQRLGAVTSAIVGISDTQTLTNKTLQEDLVDGYLDFNEESTPSTPAANTVRLYAKADGSFYKKDDTGIEQQVGSSGGAGEVNLVRNPNNAVNWNEVGSVFATPTTVTAGVPLATSIVPSAIEITGTGNDTITSSYVSHSTADGSPGVQPGKLKFEFYIDRGTGFVAGEWEVGVYSGGNRLPLSTDVAGVTLLADADGQFLSSFDYTTGSLEIRIAKIAGAGTGTITITRVIIGPSVRSLSPAIGQDEAHTLVTTGMGTITNSFCIKRRVGNRLQMKGNFTVGTLSGAVAANIELPTGLNVDISTLSASKSSLFGHYKQLLAATTDLSGQTYDGVITYSATEGGTTSLVMAGQSSSNIYRADVANVVLSSGATVSFEIDVPIAEWAGNGTMQLAENGVEYASNSDTSDGDELTAFAYGPAGSLVPTINSAVSTAARIKRVQFQTPILNGDILSIEVLVDTGAGNLNWVPVETSGDYSGCIRTESSIAYGIFSTPVTGMPNQLDVRFNRGGRTLGNTLGVNGANYPGTANDRWRVRKVSQNAALGFQDATALASGLAGPSGEYAITLSNTTNVSAESFTVARFTKVGNEVMVFFNGSLTTGAPGLTSFTINLPYTTTMTAGTDCAGTCTWFSGAGDHGSGQIVNTINTEATVQFYCSNNNSGIFSGSFQYTIKS